MLNNFTEYVHVALLHIYLELVQII